MSNDQANNSPGDRNHRSQDDEVDDESHRTIHRIHTPKREVEDRVPVTYRAEATGRSRNPLIAAPRSANLHDLGDLSSGPSKPDERPSQR